MVSKKSPASHKTSPASLKRKADKLFSVIVRKRGKCQSDLTHHAGRLECAHIISRTYSRTRHDTRNALCLCSACHRYYHQNPVLFGRFVEKLIGKSTYDELHKIANDDTLGKVDYTRLVEQLEKYEDT